jgi:long-subunit fatty acid transport protein
VSLPGAGIPPGVASGDMLDSYSVFGAAYKHDFGNGFAAAFIFGQPFGADVDYPVVPGYFASGSQAELDTDSVKMLLKYDLPLGEGSGSRFSIFGGPRYETLEATARIPFVNGYSASAEQSGEFGYAVGAAWEKPEIAARVSLTYHSEVDHSLSTTETSATPLGTSTSTTDVSSPESVNLHAQTGVAPGTLLFGSARWVDWSNYVIAPADYQTLTGGPLLSYTDDTVTYSLGIAREFNDRWAGSISIGHEPQADTLFTNLGPTDGQNSVGVGLQYTLGEVEISGGMRYIWIGDTTTALGPRPAAQFNDNDALAFGLKLGIALD